MASAGTKMDEWTPLVKAALAARFGAKTDRLYALLQETGGLISGGSILSACISAPVEKQDTDIYVPVKHIKHFLTEMIQSADPIFPAAFYSGFAASFYCDSFLRKNGIKKVYNFANGAFTDPATWRPEFREFVKLKPGVVGPGILKHGRIGRVIRHGDEEGTVYVKDEKNRTGKFNISDLVQVYMRMESEVDVMSIRNKRSPLEVVNNFDLTFCQVWFDGVDVYASHPEHIKAKKGELQYEYCLTLLGGNRFLKNRIKKYIDRGFEVTFDKRLEGSDAFKSVIAKIGSGNNRHMCTTVSEGHRTIERYEEPEFKRRWFNRIAMRYFLGVRDVKIGDVDYLTIPLQEFISFNNQIDKYDKDNTLGKKLERRQNCCPIDRFEYRVDEGYDSEDMDDAALKQIAVANYKGAAVGSEDMKYHRMCTNLVFNSKTSLLEEGVFNLVDLAFGRHGRLVRWNKEKHLLVAIEELALRTGEDILLNEGLLYDIHEHNEGEAITKIGLEQYLESTLAGDEYDVKCYAAGGGAHAGCTKKLLQSEIKMIVSPEFYTRYTAPRPKKSGLNLNVGNFEAVFKNIETVDPGWGKIYHSTMCPYCISFDERGEGCSVMTHVNPAGLPNSKSPFCESGKLVDEIVQKYKEAAARLDDGFVRLEWCVECGRPSNGHKHFNFDLTAMVNHRRIPDPDSPGHTKIDYGTCPGGGRPEMLARMMAVGDVYRRRDIRDPKEERRLAALAADAAPLDEALMARATALWASAQPYIDWSSRREDAIKAAVEADPGDLQHTRAVQKAAATAFDAANPKPPSVDFEIPFPKSKMYVDPLYERDNAVNDPDYAHWLDGPLAAPLGAAAPGAAAAAPAAAAEVSPAVKALADAAIHAADVPASAEQGAWNHEVVEYFTDIPEEALNEHIVSHLGNESGEMFQTELAMGISLHNQGQDEQINLNLIKCLLYYLLSFMDGDVPIVLPVHLIKLLATASKMGGQRVTEMINDDSIGDERHLVEIRVQIVKAVYRLFAAVAPAEGAGAEAGGRRQSFKRRRGKTDKRVRRKFTVKRS